MRSSERHCCFYFINEEIQTRQASLTYPQPVTRLIRAQVRTRAQDVSYLGSVPFLLTLPHDLHISQSMRRKDRYKERMDVLPCQTFRPKTETFRHPASLSADQVLLPATGAHPMQDLSEGHSVGVPSKGHRFCIFPTYYFSWKWYLVKYWRWQLPGKTDHILHKQKCTISHNSISDFAA